MSYSAGDEKHAEELGYHRSNWWQIRKLERQGYVFVPNPYNKTFPYVPIPKGSAFLPTPPVQKAKSRRGKK